MTWMRPPIEDRILAAAGMPDHLMSCYTKYPIVSSRLRPYHYSLAHAQYDTGEMLLGKGLITDLYSRIHSTLTPFALVQMDCGTIAFSAVTFILGFSASALRWIRPLLMDFPNSPEAGMSFLTTGFDMLASTM